MGAPGLSGRGEAKFSELLPYGVLRSSLSAMRALDRAPFREYDANVTRPEDAGRRRRTQLPVLLLDQGLATLPTSCRRAVRRASMTTENTRPRHHRVGSRPLGDPPQLGALDRALRGPRLPRARAC